MPQTIQLVDRAEMTTALRSQLVINPMSTAVLAVDVHRGHLDPTVATMPVDPERTQRVVEKLSECFAVARAAKVPVIYITMTHRRLPYPGAESMSNPFWRAVEGTRQSLTAGGKSTISGHNLEGSVQVGFPPEIAPTPTDYQVNSKKRLSAFYGTELEILLRTLKVDTTIVVGINTNTCVLCTAFEAFNRDYRVVVVKECVDSMYGQDLHAFGLENVSRCLGWVVSLEELKVEFARGAAGV